MAHQSLPTCAFHSLGKPHFTGEPFRSRYKDVMAAWPPFTKLPILYSDRYNINFFGIEKVCLAAVAACSIYILPLLTLRECLRQLHPFDSAKFGKIAMGLDRRFNVKPSMLVEPLEAPTEVPRLPPLHSCLIKQSPQSTGAA